MMKTASIALMLLLSCLGVAGQVDVDDTTEQVPADVAEVTHCASNADCQVFQDSGATCSSGACECGDETDTTPLCSKSVNLTTLKIVFVYAQAECRDFQGAGDDVWLVVVDTTREVFGEEADVMLVCNSVNFVVEVEMDPKEISKASTFVKNIEDARNENIAFKNALADSSPTVSIVAAPSQCEITDARSTVLVEDLCVATECREGFEPVRQEVGVKTYYSCELVVPRGSDGLTDSAVAGIVVASLVVVGIVAFLFYSFMLSPDSSPVQDGPVNDPFQESGSHFGTQNEPFEVNPEAAQPSEDIDDQA